MTPRTTWVRSPLGAILLAADREGITGLWFEGQKYFPREMAERGGGELPVLQEARHWLEVYFSGKEPGFTPPVHLVGTPFQQAVWALLRAIPYGETVTYGQLAARLAEARGGIAVSAQAVGGAVGHNPVSILVPCHRVVGAAGSLTGYAGGLDRKAALLRLEGAWQDRFFLPAGGTRP